MTFLAKESYNFSFNSNIGVLIINIVFLTVNLKKITISTYLQPFDFTASSVLTMSTQVAYMTFLAKESYNFFFNSNIGVLITEMPEWLWNEQKGYVVALLLLFSLLELKV